MHRKDCGDRVEAAVASLAAADRRYEAAHSPITADRCVEFLEAWQQDIVEWSRYYTRTNDVGNTRDALDVLGLTEWQRVR
jgi:hypothetical protein